jgi:hypothetical protein
LKGSNRTEGGRQDVETAQEFIEFAEFLPPKSDLDPLNNEMQDIKPRGATLFCQKIKQMDQGGRYFDLALAVGCTENSSGGGGCLSLKEAPVKFSGSCAKLFPCLVTCILV